MYGLEVISNESMDLKDLKESDDAQVYPHLRWACFNPPFLSMFQFFPASLASLLLPIRQTFDNVTPKLKTRDIGSLFIALDRPEVQKSRYLVTSHYFC